MFQWKYSAGDFNCCHSSIANGNGLFSGMLKKIQAWCMYTIDIWLSLQFGKRHGVRNHTQIINMPETCDANLFFPSSGWYLLLLSVPFPDKNSSGAKRNCPSTCRFFKNWFLTGEWIFVWIYGFHIYDAYIIAENHISRFHVWFPVLSKWQMDVVRNREWKPHIWVTDFHYIHTTFHLTLSHTIPPFSYNLNFISQYFILSFFATMSPNIYNIWRIKSINHIT